MISTRTILVMNEKNSCNECKKELWMNVENEQGKPCEMLLDGNCPFSYNYHFAVTIFASCRHLNNTHLWYTENIKVIYINYYYLIIVLLSLFLLFYYFIYNIIFYINYLLRILVSYANAMTVKNYEVHCSYLSTLQVEICNLIKILL